MRESDRQNAVLVFAIGIGAGLKDPSYHLRLMALPDSQVKGAIVVLTTGNIWIAASVDRMPLAAASQPP